MWRITASLIHDESDSKGVSYSKSVQIPTFYLNGDDLGIVSQEHAEEIAKKVICAIQPDYETLTPIVYAYKIY